MKVDAERTRNSRVNTRECSIVKVTSSSCSSTCIGVPMGTVGTSSDTIVVVTIVQGTELVVYR